MNSYEWELSKNQMSEILARGGKKKKKTYINYYM